MSRHVRLRYFASLRERAGIDEEEVETTATDLVGLYEERDRVLGLAWPREHLRVAVNGAFVPWNQALTDGDEVVFIPPVSGG